MVLSQVASIFDPLGLITPYVLEAKILMRDMCIKDKSSVNPSETRNIWDQAMTDDSRQLWINFFARLFEIEDTEFHRCLKPKCASGEPMLFIFSDSSTLAYGTCAYIRWKIGFDRYEARLIMAKNRIAPTRQLSVPRLELCGAVLACRLREKLQKEMTFKFCRVVHIVDSMIVRAQFQKESYGFGTFVATRVAEIQSKTEPSEWWWVPSDQNPADLTTRVTQVKNLGINSVWQNGPNYLTQPFELWPISQTSDIECSQLPDRIGVTMLATVVNNNNDSSLNFGDILLERFSRYDKLLKVTSLVLSIARSKSFVYAKRSACKIDSCSAELEWIKFLQNELPKDWRVRYKRLGVAVNEQGLVVVGNRMADWLTKTWNQTEFILLPMKGRFIYLLVKSVHDRDHSGVETTLAKLRSKYWIPGVRRLIKTIKSKCVRCKKLDKPKLCQQMGRLPLERLSPSPAFYYCAVDLFGPFVIKDTVKKRTHSKAYGVIFNCLSSRAVYVDCADGYDTDSFMLVLRRFISLRGYPGKMLSDAGSQLVSAKNEISQMSHQWNWETIESFGKNSGMEWELTKSADAPWENGCSEALVKSVKRCLLCTVGSSILSFSELQTVFFEVANSLNERPIGTKTNDPNEGSYLCPNDLILGRSTVRVPGGVYNEHSCFRIRWKFVQQLVSSFWYKWQRDCFPTLIIRQKWHTSTRNLVVGDVVLAQDSSVIRGQWKLARVCEAEPGRDGKVRDVRIRYKVQDPGSAYYGVQDTFVRRSVHKLVVILPVEEQAIKQ